MLGPKINLSPSITIRNTNSELECEKPDVRKMSMKMKIQSQYKTKILC